MNTNVTAGEYAKAQFNALRGNSDARDLVAAIDAATTTENIGVVPPSYLRDLIGIIDNSMPFADSIEQGTLPASGMKERARYKPEIIKDLAQRPNSWFKFVVAQESDWEEIKKDYLDSGLIEKKQHYHLYKILEILLMY